MRFLIQTVILFLIKHSINLLWIILILIAASYSINTYNKYKGLNTELQLVKEAPSLLKDVESKIELYNGIYSKFSEKLKDIDGSNKDETVREILKEVDRLKEGKSRLEKEQKKEGTFEENFKNPLNVGKLPDCLRRDLELDLITWLLQYLDKAIDLIKNKSFYLQRLKFYNEQYAITLEEHKKTKIEYDELVTYSFGR